MSSFWFVAVLTIGNGKPILDLCQESDQHPNLTILESYPLPVTIWSTFIATFVSYLADRRIEGHTDTHRVITIPTPLLYKGTQLTNAYF